MKTNPRYESYYNSAGSYIRFVRKRTGMTTRELADLLGVSTRFLSYVESGQSPLPRKHFRALCCALSEIDLETLWMLWLDERVLMIDVRGMPDNFLARAMNFAVDVDRYREGHREK